MLVVHDALVQETLPVFGSRPSSMSVSISFFPSGNGFTLRFSTTAHINYQQFDKQYNRAKAHSPQRRASSPRAG